MLRRFGIDPDVVKSIKPISLIEVDEYGEYPAVEIVEKMGVKDQFDPRVDEATSTIYRKEFHTGILKPITGKYAGKRVQDVKSELIEDFKQAGIADMMYDLPEKVICRCTTRCIVKVLSDQWFLRYSDSDWKQTAHEAIDRAKIFPEAARTYFHDKIDWLHDWACARRTGLGTPLPWSSGWIVETLSDSTIYMAFYTIVKHIRKHSIKAEQLTNEVFDYIFFGEGDPEKLTETSRIDMDVLEEMRREFTYWYPVDLRVSAKELVPNHLSFFIFQHTALFPREQWPRAIGVNGMLAIEGKKMSKSKGNFLTLSNTVDRFGADVTRLTLMLGAEDMDDPDWRVENARSIDSKLRALYRFINEMISLQGDSEANNIDRWLISVIQGRIRIVTQAIETLKTRTAAEVALFEVWNDIRWYLRRAESPNPKTLKEVAEIWIRLLAPFTPYLCEELWRLLKKDGFISTAKWPSYDESKVDVNAEESEDMIRDLMADTSSIIEVTKITPKKICYYVASNLKWRAYLEMLERSLSAKVEMGTIMRELMKNSDLRKEAKRVSAYIWRTLQEINAMPADQKKRRLEVGELDEKTLLNEAKRFLEREFKAEILIYGEDDPQLYDPKKRANLAKPYRPAIYIE